MRAWIHLGYALAVAMFCTLMPGVAMAVWSNNPAVNTAVTNLTGAGTKPAITSDGSGGAIIAWMSASNDIYVQRIDANGNLQWGATGKALTSDGINYNPQITTDMSGGAFIVWQKGSAGDGIYAQLVDGEGTGLWEIGDQMVVVNGDGISGNHRNPRIVSDGQHGAIIVWEDSRSAGTTGFDLYAQRFYFEDDDYYEWVANGVEICAAPGDQINPQLASDGSGGAILTWQDGRNFADFGWFIFVQKIDSAGIIQWQPGGNWLNYENGTLEKPQIVSDGTGGAIITWQNANNSTNGYDIYAQRVSSTGTYVWNPYTGVPVSVGLNHQKNPQILSDGNSGAIISWLGINSGNGTSTGIYAQRVNGSGAVQWLTNGVTVASPAGIDTGDPPQMVSDGGNGAIIAWADQRNGGYDIYSQRINGTNGAAQWTADGAPVSTAANDQQLPRIISDGSSGAVITWQDQRSADGGIYSQKVLSDGSLPVVTVAPTVTTTAVTAITFTSASSGGIVTSDGGADVTDRGICWGPSANPASNCITAGTGTGQFGAVINGLTPGTPYHVRAYATNSVGTSYGDYLQFTTVAGWTLTLGLTLNGGATGRVTSNPAGIDCTTAQCTPVMFVADSNITLSATPDADSTLLWGGDCEVLNGKCTVTMSGDKTATATFSYVQPVRIEGSSAPYSLVGGAYAGLPDEGGTIQARVHEFSEELNLNRSLPVVFRGGYDTSYSGNNGVTTVKGSMTLTNGSLTVENLVIK
jgi:hypothetical protein